MINIRKAVTDAKIATAVIYPTCQYKGDLPVSTVKKGSKGSSVKQVQSFLNWCIKANLDIDGNCGKKTAAAIKKYQKQYKLKVDGIFGPKSNAKAKEIVAKYNKKSSKKSDIPEWVERANAWCRLIANDDDFGYNKFIGNNDNTYTCPICSRRVLLKLEWDSTKRKYKLISKKIKCILRYLGWNCIGFAWAVWHHGGGLKCTCNCHVISNELGNKLYHTKTNAEAVRIVRERSKLKDIQVIINKKGIPKSQWKSGDICLQFSGRTFVHMFYYMGNKQIADAIGSNGKVSRNKQIAIRNYNKYSAKIIIRYKGM